MPAGLYPLLRDDGDSPVMASQSVARFTDRQVVRPLLCGDCEQRFSENGEDYVLPLVRRGKSFKLLDIVCSGRRYQVEGQFRVYSAMELPIDVSSLAYFALSIIWRGVPVTGFGSSEVEGVQVLGAWNSL
jgi:hypothetical protein